MSYLALFKQADARLRGTQPGNESDAINEGTPPAEGCLFVSSVSFVPEASHTAVDPSAVARVLGLPLDQLDRVLEIRVPWLPVSLWFVPDERAVEGLLGDGVTRGRIWTAAELQDLLSLPRVTPATARTLAEAKLAMDGDVVTVRTPPGSSR